MESILPHSLQANLPQRGLKTSRRDVGAAEKCIRFGVGILKASRENKGLGNDQRCIVEYFVETL
jgi:hypothetical protein